MYGTTYMLHARKKKVERRLVSYALAGNRIRGPTMGMLDFTTKPLALQHDRGIRMFLNI